MRTTILCLGAAVLLALVAAPTAGAEELAQAPSLAAVAPAAPLAAATEVALAAPAACPRTSAGIAGAVPEPEWLASSCCKSRCLTNRDCDRFCGAGNGVCTWVNSCCRDCLCSAL